MALSTGPLRAVDPTRTVDPANRLTAAVAVVGWCCLLAAAGPLLSQPLGTPGGLIAVGQSFSPWMPAVALVVVIAARIMRHDALGTTGALVTVAYLAWLSPIAFPAALPAPAADARPFTVVTANVLFSNDGVGGVVDLMHDTDADVITIVEATPTMLAGLDADPISQRYPHRLELPQQRASGMAIWSRHPFVGEPAILPGSDLAVVVDHPDGAFRLIGMHPPPPVLDHGEWERDLRRIPRSAATDLPVVILGDFNASWFHPPFRRAVDAAGLSSATIATGEGLSMTWPSNPVIPAFVAIDHVLIGGGLTVLDTEVVAVDGSDHHAVKAELAFAEPDG